jgi:TatA/E family protein of Tat protein translocase
MNFTLAFLDGVGGGEMMWVLLIALLLFGGDKLPGLAKGMGKAIREFKKAASDVEHEIKRAIDEAPEPSGSKAPKPYPPVAIPGSTATAFPPQPDTIGGNPATPYGMEGDLYLAPAPAPVAPPVSDPPPPTEKPPVPPAPASPYEHLNDL